MTSTSARDKCKNLLTLQSAVFTDTIIMIVVCRTSADGDFKDYIRLAFCHYNEAILKDGVSRLSQAIKFMINNKK